MLVSPAFHGYHSGIAAALSNQGFEVLTHIYDKSSTVFDALANRAAVNDLGNFAAKVKQQKTERAIEELRRIKPDLVVVVKGDLLGADWWQEISASKVPSWLWIYDELANTQFPAEALEYVTNIASYSKADTQSLRSRGISVAYVPGGFDSHEVAGPSQNLGHAVTFTGARYPQREAILRDVAAAGIPVKAYGREWSRKFTDVVRTGQYRNPGFATASDLTRAQSYAVMASSLASVNHHGTHDGFNMRMFEACGVAGVHLVDRIDVDIFYEPGTEVFTFESSAELVAKITEIQKVPELATKVRAAAQKRTLAKHTLDSRMADLLAMRDYRHD